MTNSETKFRNWIKKEKVGALIKKLPDYKQAGKQAVVGLPDYVVFTGNTTEWWEVKSGFGDTLNLYNHFTDGQKVVFKRMLDNGVDVNIWSLTKSYKWKILKFSELYSVGKVKWDD